MLLSISGAAGSCRSPHEAAAAVAEAEAARVVGGAAEAGLTAAWSGWRAARWAGAEEAGPVVAEGVAGAAAAEGGDNGVYA